MSDDLIESMNVAIANKDLAQFARLLELKPEMWSSEAKLFQESDSNVTLLRKLTMKDLRSGFSAIPESLLDHGD